MRNRHFIIIILITCFGCNRKTSSSDKLNKNIKDFNRDTATYVMVNNTLGTFCHKTKKTEIIDVVGNWDNTFVWVEATDSCFWSKAKIIDRKVSLILKPSGIYIKTIKFEDTTIVENGEFFISATDSISPIIDFAISKGKDTIIKIGETFKTLRFRLYWPDTNSIILGPLNEHKFNNREAWEYKKR